MVNWCAPLKRKDLIKKNIQRHINQLVDIPIITCGGAGNFDHIVNLFKETNVSAAACSSLFHFNDYNPIQIRSFLKNNGIKMRILK